MVVVEKKITEASACNARNGWRSNPLLATLNFGRMDTVEDARIGKSPVIVPCYNGRSLKIHEDLVVNGLSAISIRHHKGNCTEAVEEVVSELRQIEEKQEREKVTKDEKKAYKIPGNVKKHSATALPGCLGERLKRRNSFWNMHRPELSKLTWPESYISPAMLEEFFHHHLQTHGTFCEPLHVESDEDTVSDGEICDYTILRELAAPTVLPPDEKFLNIMEKSRSVQLNDEDLDPEIMVHKSRAEFCVSIGEYTRKPLSKRSTSHHIPKSGAHLTEKFESLPASREGYFSKEEIVSSVISDRTAPFGVFAVEIDDGKAIPPVESESDPILGYPKDSEQVTEEYGDPEKLGAVLSPKDEENGISEIK